MSPLDCAMPWAEFDRLIFPHEGIMCPACDPFGALVYDRNTGRYVCQLCLLRIAILGESGNVRDALNGTATHPTLKEATR